MINFPTPRASVRALASKRFYSPLPRASRVLRRVPPTMRRRIVPDEIYYPETGSTILSPSDPISRILSQHTLVLERQIEMMNLFLGFEQANRYIIMDTNGNQLGFLLERDLGLTKLILRQVYRLHRPFTVDVFDNSGDLLLTIKRPFSLVNSHIKSILPGFQNYEDGVVIGESVQRWHPWRRRYNLFLSETASLQTDTTATDAEPQELYEQFGEIDAPFLSFEFPIQDEQGRVNGSVGRNWVGLGREMFTDTGVYIMRMAPQSFYGLEAEYPDLGRGMTLDQRLVMLGTAISIDFDYFSRHSRQGGGGLFSFGAEPFRDNM